MLERAFQTLGRLQSHSSELVHARDPVRKITPTAPAQVPALENHYFSVTYKELPYIRLFFTLRKNLGVVICSQSAQRQRKTCRYPQSST